MQETRHDIPRNIQMPMRAGMCCLLALALALFACGSTAYAQVLTRVSVSSAANEANGKSTRPAISDGGRYVAFSSDADNLITGDNNLVRDVFVHDRDADNDGIFDEPGAIATTRVSVGSGGAEANGKSDRPSISGDGRFVAFYSDATNLIPSDTNLVRDIFVRDRDPDENGVFDEGNGVTILASINGVLGNGGSNRPSISADGRYVAFRTKATNLAPGDANGVDDILVRDLQASTTVRVSVHSSGATATGGDSDQPSISSDGRFVAFYSDASNLVDGDEPTYDLTTCPLCTGSRDVFVHDRDPDGNGVFDGGNGTTERVSVNSAEEEGNAGSNRPSISADGRYIAFKSDATNLVANDNNGYEDVFLHDRQTGTTILVSVGAVGGDSSVPAISADGRFVAFRSGGTGLVAGLATGGLEQVYLFDRFAATVTPISVGASGLAGNNHSSRPAISADGRVVAFWSDAFSLVPGDTNLVRDIFVRDTDSDNDGVVEGSDNCPTIANADQTDLDSDGNGDVCDDDRDGDGTLNTADECPDDAEKNVPGQCGCGSADTDADSDGTVDCNDECPWDPAKIKPGACGCGIIDTLDENGNIVCEDACPDDLDKLAPGVCGCGVPDTDNDDDGTADCIDQCPTDPNKIEPGACGCGENDVDGDTDGTPDCDDQCPDDGGKTTPGLCGCGVSDTDTDGDTVPDCFDNCVWDLNLDQGDGDFDGVGDPCDNCPAVENDTQADADDDGVGDACDTQVGDGTTDPPPDGQGGDGGSQPASPCGAIGVLPFPFMLLGMLTMRRRYRLEPGTDGQRLR